MLPKLVEEYMTREETKKKESRLPKLDETQTRKYTILGSRDPRPGAYGKFAVRWSQTFNSWVIGNDPAYMLYKNHDMAQAACDVLNRKWGFE